MPTHRSGSKPVDSQRSSRDSAAKGKGKGKGKTLHPADALREAVMAKLDDMKAKDMLLIDVRGKTSVTDFLLLASGTSTRHVKAMADEVVITAKAAKLPPLGVEGEREAEWVLVDLGDMVVHLMLPKTREHYQLERMWDVSAPSASGVTM